MQNGYFCLHKLSYHECLLIMKDHKADVIVNYKMSKFSLVFTKPACFIAHLNKSLIFSLKY